MTAEEARAFIAEHHLADHVEQLVDDAPPIPDAAAELIAKARSTTT